MFIQTEIAFTNANVILILKSSTSVRVPIQRFGSVHQVQVLESASLDFASDPRPPQINTKFSSSPADLSSNT